MKLQDKHVVVIGAGISGLTAADALAVRGVGVSLLERSPAPGGHAIGFSCKATDKCVKCGACKAQTILQRVLEQPNIDIYCDTQAKKVDLSQGYTVHYETQGASTNSGSLRADAVVVATGFKVYDPSDKHFGYGRYANVVTNLEAESILRKQTLLQKPSDNLPVDRIAFIQCVGSRDTQIGHDWCSKICCGSALRMARLAQARQPELKATFFYIDVQTFGKDFQAFYDQACGQIQMVRSIPGDIFQLDDGCLQAVYFDPDTHQPLEATFDMVVLSAGMMPVVGSHELARMFNWPLAENGFLQGHATTGGSHPPGVYVTGTALGPASIAESIDSAGKAVWDVLNYLTASGD